MSLDVYFFSYLDGKPVPISIDILTDALGKFVDWRDGRVWALKFPDGRWSDLYVNEELEIWSFSLNRPALSPELSQGVFDIMRKTRGILVCSGAGACVTDVSIISRIDFIHSVSPIHVVNDPSGIRVRIAEALAIAAGYTNYIRRLVNGPPR